MLSIFNDFTITSPTEPGTFTPGPHQEPTLTALLDEVRVWTEAFAPLREQPAA